MIYKYEQCMCGVYFDDGLHRLCETCRVDQRKIDRYNKSIDESHAIKEMCNDRFGSSSKPTHIKLYDPNPAPPSGSTYLATDSSTYTIKPSGSIVTLQDIVTFTRGGKLVGSLNAKFDFTDLDQILHQQAINLIRNMSVNMCLLVEDREPVVSKPVVEEQVEEESVTMWSRFKNKLGMK